MTIKLNSLYSSKVILTKIKFKKCLTIEKQAFLTVLKIVKRYVVLIINGKNFFDFKSNFAFNY